MAETPQGAANQAYRANFDRAFAPQDDTVEVPWMRGRVKKENLVISDRVRPNEILFLNLDLWGKQGFGALRPGEKEFRLTNIRVPGNEEESPLPSPDNEHRRSLGETVYPLEDAEMRVPEGAD